MIWYVEAIKYGKSNSMKSEFHVNLHIYDCCKEKPRLNTAFIPRLCYLFHHFAPGSIPSGSLSCAATET